MDRRFFEIISDEKRLREAATALYLAGRWESPGVDNDVQTKLWEDLRDALSLEPGTATAKDVSAEAQS